MPSLRTPEPSRTGRPRVALVGRDEAVVAWLRDGVAAVAESVTMTEPAALTDPLDAGHIDAVIADAMVGIGEVLDLVGRRVPVLLVVGDGTEAPVIRDERVYYVVRRSLPPADVAELVRSALHSREATASPIGTAAEAARLQQILTVSARFAAASDLEAAARLADQAIAQLVACDRSHCLFHDAQSGELWSETEPARQGQAATGLTGFAARTGRSVCVERADADPRFASSIDDPDGDGGQRMLVQPIEGVDGNTHAVLVAVRETSQPPFTADDQAAMRTFADKAGPMMQHLALIVETEAILRAEREGKAELFRNEAMVAHTDLSRSGDVVRVSPSWVRWSYWVLVLLVAVSGAYVTLGEVDQHSAGPAVVRLHDRTELVAQHDGALVRLDVHAGQRVEPGQVLAQLDDAEAQAELQRVQHELDTQLRKHMLDPQDASATQAVVTLRGRRQGALDRLEQRVLKAPHAGVVGDLRIRPGQHIAVGDVVMSLLRDGENKRVVALLPGADRPQLRPGLPLRLELSGFRYSYQTLVIDEVDDEVIGPAEAKRFLGPALGDAIAIPGPVVLVQAHLREGTFQADSTEYEYHDGMQGIAEVPIRTETILQALIPALKDLDGGDDG